MSRSGETAYYYSLARLAVKDELALYELGVASKMVLASIGAKSTPL
jgi:hypothetical protein